MERPAYRQDGADLESFTRAMNEYCSRTLLEALVANHGGKRPSVDTACDPEPELLPAPAAPVILPPIPNEAMAEAVSIAFPNWVNAIKRIQHAVCKEYEVTLSELCSQRRNRNVVRPRQIAMYLCKTLTGRSFPEIGRRFGGRDHTTALAAVRRIELLCSTDETFRIRVENLAGTIGGVRG